MMSDTQSRPLGRRERAKHDKMSRIFEAATELFLTNGYTATTTQQIADRADIAEGTLFRYAATKAELLLMVVNAQFTTAVDAGVASISDLASLPKGTPYESVVAELSARIASLVDPIVRHSIANGDNTLAYQQQVLFGASGDQHRVEGLAAANAFVDVIALVLDSCEQSDQSGGIEASAAAAADTANAVTASHAPHLPGAHRAAHMIFAAMTLELAVAIRESRGADDVIVEIRDTINIAVRGYLATRAAASGGAEGGASTTHNQDQHKGRNK